MSVISSIGKAAPLQQPKPDPTSPLAKAAKEFEGVLVRQLLQASKMTGEKAEGGYQAMALDAMCTGVMKGGGLGLARSLEASLQRALPHPVQAMPGDAVKKSSTDNEE